MYNADPDYTVGAELITNTDAVSYTHLTLPTIVDV